MLSGYRSLLFVLILSISSFGQINFIEDFNYTAGNTISVSNSLWRISTGLSPIVASGNLSYPNYPSSESALSNKLFLERTGITQDLVHSIGTIENGSIYCSFLFQVTSLDRVTSESYFFRFADALNNRASILIRKIDNNTYNIGLKKKRDSGTESKYDNTVLNTNQTYLLVVSYTFVSGTYNDYCKLWINPNLDGEEPEQMLYDASSNDILDIKEIVYTLSAGTADMYIDAIRVARTWNESALPVELQSFNAEAEDNCVVLKWKTATEVNNYGFEVERSFDKSNWECIGFVNGNGNCNRVSNYQFIDESANGSSVLYYRLKQIDTDGTYTYSEVTEVKTHDMNYALGQNYPNPFNPETTIDYSVAEKGFVNIKVYDVNGKEVNELVNKSSDPGEYSLTFNGSALPSGVYMYRIRVNGFVQSRKMLLLK